MTLLSAQYERITPEIAAEYLVKNTRNYRKLSHAKISVIKRELIAGVWMPSTQGIGFDTDDCMVDGQHRLSAIVTTKIPVTMLVCRGLPPAVKDKIDVGNRRTFADLTGLPHSVISTVRVPFRAVLNGNGRSGVVKGRIASTTDLTFMKPYLEGELGRLAKNMNDVCGSTHGLLNVGVRAAIALSIMNGNCTEDYGLDIFNKLVSLRWNRKGIPVTKLSLLERRATENELPLLLLSLVTKIRDGVTPVFDQNSNAYVDATEVTQRATKLMFLTMQALDSSMNEQENFVNEYNLNVVQALELE